jgi:hypothetical protein
LRYWELDASALSSPPRQALEVPVEGKYRKIKPLMGTKYPYFTFRHLTEGIEFY